MSSTATATKSESSVTVTAAVTTLLEVDCRSCGFGELDVLSAAAQRLRGFLTAAEARIARRRDELCAGDRPPDPDPPDPGEAAGSDRGRDPVPPSPDIGRPSAGVPSLDAVGGTRDRRSATDAARDAARGRAGATFPAFEAALAAGRIDAAHLDAIATALDRLAGDDAARARLSGMEAGLLATARLESPERFRRRCLDLSRRLAADHGLALEQRQRQRASIRRWWNTSTGMYHLHAELDPEAGAKVEAALDAQLDQRRHAHSTESTSTTGNVLTGTTSTSDTVGTGDGAEAPTRQRLEVESFLDIVTSALATEPRTPEIAVHIDVDTLVTGVFESGSVCETATGTPLSPAAVRRMACDAGLLPVVLGGEGLPLDVGRSRRLATAAQRSALRSLHRTCAHPACSVRFSRCRIHHVDPWERGGTTDLDRMVPLCERHHHLVHEGGWALTITADRVTTWRRPDGSTWFEGSTADRPPPERAPDRQPASQSRDRANASAASAGRWDGRSGACANPCSASGYRTTVTPVASRSSTSSGGV